MTTQQTADRLIELIRELHFEKAHKELYANDAVSIEHFENKDFPGETRGLKAIVDKGYKFESMLEKIHSITVSEPLITANCIAFVITADFTLEERPRTVVTELGVYTLENGKIISEQFFR